MNNHSIRQIFGVFPLTYLRFSDVVFFTFYYLVDIAIIVKKISLETFGIKTKCRLGFL